MPARLPYAIATMQIHLRGFLWFELSHPMKFANITEINPDSICRIPLIIKLRWGFPPRAELRGSPGVFAKDDTLKDFLERKSAALARLRILRNRAIRHTFAESATMVDEYAIAPGGVARRMMRFARRLKPEVQEEPSGSSGEDNRPFAGGEKTPGT